jgi:hypothetical protein
VKSDCPVRLASGFMGGRLEGSPGLMLLWGVAGVAVVGVPVARVVAGFVTVACAVKVEACAMTAS